MAQSPAPSESPRALPSLSNIRTSTQQFFGVRPCLWQLKVAETILKGDNDVICVAGTGMGKTLTFWMPLLVRENGIQIVVTPLNLLGKQNVACLMKAGIQAISISGETATQTRVQAISAFEYRVIMISPEQVMKPDGGFEKLLKNPWGEFRPEYKELGRLRYVLPRSVPLLVTSATIMKKTLHDLTHLLHMSPSRTVIVRRSSDRPNIKIGVKKIKYALNSYADLAFLIPAGFKVDDPPLPKFLVFFDSIPDSISAACTLRRRLPRELRDKIKWFNAEMSTSFKEAELEKLTSGDTWGLCTTTSFGMGMDVPDISLVIQWRATCKLAALWQRFGRAVRSKQLTGTALLFAEKEYFDDERAAKAARKAKRTTTRKRSAKEANLTNGGMSRPSKRVAIASGDEPSNHESRHGVCARLDNSLLDEESGNEEDLPEIADTLGSALLEAFARGEGQFPVHSGKRRKKDLDPGIDYLINASERSGVECRRKVFDTCFDNAAAESDHLECNNGDVLGCRRCNVVAPATCCDIHNPSAFSSFESHLPKPPRMSQRSRLPKYTKDKYDYKLEEALLDWREDKTVAVYGWACLNDHGPVIMTATTLNRVVDCAHHHKIQTREDLKRETAWMNSDQYGDEIVNLIKQHAAPATSLLVSTPLRIRGMALGGDQTAGPSTSPHLTPPSSSLRFTTVFSASGESSNIPSKRRSRCSACGQEGHNARNRVCPKHPSHVSTGDKENTSSKVQLQ